MKRKKETIIQVELESTKIALREASMDFDRYFISDDGQIWGGIKLPMVIMVKKEVKDGNLETR